MQAVVYRSDPNLAQNDSDLSGSLPKPGVLIQTETRQPETPLPQPIGMAQAKAKAKSHGHAHGHHDSHPHFLAQQDDPNYFNYMAQQEDSQFGQAFGQVQGEEGGMNDPYAPDFCFA